MYEASVGFRRGGGSYPKIRKTSVVEAYQEGAARIIQTAKPSRWIPPEGFLRLTYEWHLTDDIDADNLMKVLNDAIAPAIGVNDKLFLESVLPKVLRSKNPHVTVTIEPWFACPCCGR